MERKSKKTLRTHVFLGLLTNKMGRCAPPAPPIGASLILPVKLMICRENSTKNRWDSLENPNCCHLVKRVLHGVPGLDLNPKPALQQAIAIYAAHCLSYAAPWDTLHPSEIFCTLLSYAAPFWTTLHPSELLFTLLSYASPFWATLHPSELCFTFLSYTSPFLAMLYPSELCCTLLSMLTLLSYAAPSWATRFTLITSHILH